MPDVRKSLLQFVFAGAFMKRWNDKLRPMEMLEVDKQAHKMIAAWLLYELAAEDMPLDERLALGERVVEGGLFDYFYRLVITDIKPPIYYRIKQNPDHHSRLTEWVLAELEPRLKPLGPAFWDRLTAYLTYRGEEDTARRILSAAHLFASNWEFSLIRRMAPYDDELAEIQASFDQGLAAYEDLAGVPELMAAPPDAPARKDGKDALGRFAHLCGQLRFQKRWSQTPRIPETSVLGHMFLVAAYAYFFSMALGAGRARTLNNFFCGLFHDLPELLTRDIISPVKKSVADIGDMIREYEKAELTRRVLDPLRAGGRGVLADRLSYLLGLELGDEFKEAVRLRGKVVPMDLDKLEAEGDRDDLDPKDGRMLKVCDDLAAFIEAYTTLRNGISNDQLQVAIWRLRDKYRHESLGERLHVGALMADFD